MLLFTSFYWGNEMLQTSTNHLTLVLSNLVKSMPPPSGPSGPSGPVAGPRQAPRWAPWGEPRVISVVAAMATWLFYQRSSWVHWVPCKGSHCTQAARLATKCFSRSKWLREPHHGHHMHKKNHSSASTCLNLIQSTSARAGYLSKR